MLPFNKKTKRMKNGDLPVDRSKLESIANCIFVGLCIYIDSKTGYSGLCMYMGLGNLATPVEA